MVAHHILWSSHSVRLWPRHPIFPSDDHRYPERDNQLQRISLGSGSALHHLGAHLLDDDWTYRLRYYRRNLIRSSPCAQRMPCSHDLPAYKHCLAGVGALLYESLCMFVWSYFRLPEAKGRTYEELDLLFQKKVPARKFASTFVDPYAMEIAPSQEALAPTQEEAKGIK
jgi:hypothetical protein